MAEERGRERKSCLIFPRADYACVVNTRGLAKTSKLHVCPLSQPSPAKYLRGFFPFNSNHSRRPCRPYTLAANAETDDSRDDCETKVTVVVLLRVDVSGKVFRDQRNKTIAMISQRNLKF